MPAKFWKNRSALPAKNSARQTRSGGGPVGIPEIDKQFEILGFRVLWIHISVAARGQTGEDEDGHYCIQYLHGTTFFDPGISVFQGLAGASGVSGVACAGH